MNIAHETSHGHYSREEVLTKNPDVIIIVNMGITGLNEKKTWENYRTIKAVKNKRIFIVDSYKFCSPTPITFVEALRETVKILHPTPGR